MFCENCGSNITDDADFCPNCGNRVKRVQGQGMMQPVQRRGIDTIFSGVMFEKTMAAYLEMGIFVIACAAAVLAFLAGILVDWGNYHYISGSFRALWLFLMVFIIGYGVLVALRKRIFAILYGSAAFFFCMLIPYFNCERKISSVFLDNRSQKTPVGMWIIFTFMILAALGLLVCLAVHIFSNNYRLDQMIMILGLSLSISVVIFGIVSYAAPRQSYRSSYRQSAWEAEIMAGLESIQMLYASEKNGLGTLAYAMISLANGAYLFLFFRGMIDNRKQKIQLNALFPQGGAAYRGNSGWQQGQEAAPAQAVAAVSEPAIQFFSGAYAGRALRIQGEVIIGSEQGKAHVVLQDAYISSQHCVIRFNRNTGQYEVRDLSSNGVFLGNGAQLQRGAYMACPRGTVLYLGSKNQKIRLR